MCAGVVVDRHVPTGGLQRGLGLLDDRHQAPPLLNDDHPRAGAAGRRREVSLAGGTVAGVAHHLTHLAGLLSVSRRWLVTQGVTPDSQPCEYDVAKGEVRVVFVPDSLMTSSVTPLQRSTAGPRCWGRLPATRARGGAALGASLRVGG